MPVADSEDCIASAMNGAAENAIRSHYKLSFLLATPSIDSCVTRLSGQDGASPLAALTLDAFGNLYGTTGAGGRTVWARYSNYPLSKWNLDSDHHP